MSLCQTLSKENETSDSAFRRFKRRCKAGASSRNPQREHYEKPQPVVKKNLEAARKRNIINYAKSLAAFSQGFLNPAIFTSNQTLSSGKN